MIDLFFLFFKNCTSNYNLNLDLVKSDTKITIEFPQRENKL